MAFAKLLNFNIDIVQFKNKKKKISKCGQHAKPNIIPLVGLITNILSYIERIAHFMYRLLNYENTSKLLHGYI